MQDCKSPSFWSCIWSCLLINRFLFLLIRKLYLITAFSRRTEVSLDIVIPGTVMNHFSKKIQPVWWYCLKAWHHCSWLDHSPSLQIILISAAASGKKEGALQYESGCYNLACNPLRGGCWGVGGGRKSIYFRKRILLLYSINIGNSIFVNYRVHCSTQLEMLEWSEGHPIWISSI